MDAGPTVIVAARDYLLFESVATVSDHIIALYSAMVLAFKNKLSAV